MSFAEILRFPCCAAACQQGGARRPGTHRTYTYRYRRLSRARSNNNENGPDRCGRPAAEQHAAAGFRPRRHREPSPSQPLAGAQPAQRRPDSQRQQNSRFHAALPWLQGSDDSHLKWMTDFDSRTSDSQQRQHSWLNLFLPAVLDACTEAHGPVCPDTLQQITSGYDKYGVPSLYTELVRPIAAQHSYDIAAFLRLTNGSCWL